MVGADGRGLQPALCSGPPPCRCLVHIVRSASLKYSKIRQFQEHFQFDVCRHEVRYGCLREDSCHFAHSFIELRVWLLQQYSGGGGAGAGHGGMTDSRQGGASSSGRGLPGHHWTQRLCPQRPVRLGGFWDFPSLATARGSTVEKGEAGRARLLLHRLPGWSSASHVPSLSLHLLLCEMVIIISGSELTTLKAIYSLISQGFSEHLFCVRRL